MTRLRKALGAIVQSLDLQNALLDHARRRYFASRRRAFKANEQKKAAQATADTLRKQGHPQRAARKDKKALRLEVVATKNHQRAIFWRGRTKVITQRIDKLLSEQQKLETQIKALGVTIKGNKAVGGTAKERWIAVCLASVAHCANGSRRNFYSQVGAWDVDHPITGERYGERSDCSSYVTSVAKAAGLPDPNGEDWQGGYTGTLVGQHNGWKQVTEKAMKRHGWGYIVYGTGVGHHTEAYIGPGDRTAGHGSAPVDFGTVNLFGDNDYRCYIHD